MKTTMRHATQADRTSRAFSTPFTGSSTRRAAAFGIVLALAGLTANIADAQMVGLGFLQPGDGESDALAVSADGSTVVGASYSDGYATSEAFIWSAATGMVGLGHLPDGLPSYSIATGVSADGSAVVGYAATVDGLEAWIWTQASGMVGLGFLPGNSVSIAWGLSADGSTVVGESGGEAFKWTAATGMVGLGFLSGDTSSQAKGVSADGSTVVGSSGGEAFIWTATMGMVGLGYLPDAFFPYSEARGVSADGSTVVGISLAANSAEAFIWTAAAGMIGLGGLPGAPYPNSEGYSVSADGSTVVGSAINSQGNEEAFAWTAATGIIGLGYLPGALSAAVPPLSRATGVSGDGSMVVGYSLGAERFEAFVAYPDLTRDPAELLFDLIDEVVSLNLRHGIENSLDAKLDAALATLESHNVGTAINNLNAFINAVKAQSGKAIPKASADQLIAHALEIIDLIN